MLGRMTPHVLTEKDGRELITLLNEVMEVASRALLHQDFYLHYHEGAGWRVRFHTGDDEGTKAWVSGRGSGTKLLDALRVELQPIFADLAPTPTRRRRDPARRPARRRKRR
jgi:hypothetical protein